MTPLIGPNTRMCASVRHLQSTVRDAVVLLVLDSGEYFSLNAVGVRVWALVQTERTFSELVKVVVEEYDVTPDIAASDLCSMLRDLERHGLIELRDGA